MLHPLIIIRYHFLFFVVFLLKPHTIYISIYLSESVLKSSWLDQYIKLAYFFRIFSHCSSHLLGISFLNFLHPSQKKILYWFGLELSSLLRILQNLSFTVYSFIYHERPRGVVANVWDYYGRFELQSRYYVQFRTNTLEKGMDPVIPIARGKIVSLVLSYIYC